MSKSDQNNNEFDVFPIDKQIYNDGKCYISLIAGDIWTNVLKYLNTESLMNLWFTGNKQLLDVLGAKGAVREFVIEEAFPLDFFIWPTQFISQLAGLRHIHICMSGDPFARKSRTLTPERTALLPRHLSSLHLEFFDGINSEAVSLLPPTLTRLILPCNNTITSDGFKLLPRGLNELDLSTNVHLTSSLLSDLPHGLTKLHAFAKGLAPCEELFDRIPNQILEFKLNGDISKWTIKDTLKLPKSLISTNLGNYDQIIHQELLSVPNFRLSENLQELDLQYYTEISDQLFQHLPSGLTCLKLGWDTTQPPTWSNAAFLHLPRSLKTLILMPFKPKPHEIRISSPFLPPNLSSDMFVHLPHGLETFHIWAHRPHSMHASEGINELNDLPISITDLDIRPTTAEYVSTIATMLPRLQRLRGRPFLRWRRLEKDDRIPSFVKAISTSTDPIDTPDCFNFPRDPAYLAFLKFSHLTYLKAQTIQSDQIPQSLTYLEVMAKNTWKDKDILELPDGLKHLIIHRHQLSLTDECLPALPHGLTNLQFKGESKITGTHHKFPPKLRNLVWQRSNQLSVLTLFNVESLPYHLTSLEISDPKISDDCVLRLPPFITKLTIFQTKILTGSCLKHLNSNMYHLQIPYLDLYDEDIENLPRGLQYLDISEGSPDLTDSCVRHFPRSLKVLKIPATWLTDVSMVDFPRSLEVLAIHQATHLTRKCLRDLPRRLKCIRLPLGVDNISIEDIREVKPNISQIWN